MFYKRTISLRIALKYFMVMKFYKLKYLVSFEEVAVISV
jgi:hypothetical protein